MQLKTRFQACFPKNECSERSPRNQESAFLFGAEKYAKEFNWPVVFVSIQKIKRGTYEVSFQLITDQPKKEAKGKIINDFANLLQADINQNPPYWLWTHNRWKKSKQLFYSNLYILKRL